MKKLRHFALLCALMPAALIGGCGGGAGVTPIGPQQPTFPGTDLRNAAFRLDNGQIGLFSLRRDGNAVAGTLRILDAATSQPKIPSGTTALTGNFADPGSFSVTGNGGNLTLNGTLPTAATPGTYSLITGNISRSGTLFYSGLPDVAASTPYGASGDLTFSNVKALGANDFSPNARISFASVTPTGAGAFVTAPADLNYPGGGEFYYSIENSINSQTLRATGTRVNVANLREDFLVTFGLGTRDSALPLFVGQTFDLSNSQTGDLPISNSVSANFASDKIPYQSVSGLITIKSIGPESVALELSDVVLVTNLISQNPGDTRPLPNDGQPTGSVTINGSFVANGLRTLVRNNQ